MNASLPASEALSVYDEKTMKSFDWSSVPREDLNPLFGRQCIHTQTMTVARIYIKKGGIVPTHSHHNEQVSMCDSGLLRFLFDGKEVMLGPGQALVIPPSVSHSAEALEDFSGMDIFSPERQDWITGTDAYLRR